MGLYCWRCLLWMFLAWRRIRSIWGSTSCSSRVDGSRSVWCLSLHRSYIAHSSDRGCFNCTICYAYDCALISGTNGSVKGYRRVLYFWGFRKQSVYRSPRFQRFHQFRFPVFGLIIGALLTSFASWPWVFYFMSILGILESIVVFFLCPPISRRRSSALDKAKRFKRLDIFGVSLVTGMIN